MCAHITVLFPESKGTSLRIFRRVFKKHFLPPSLPLALPPFLWSLSRRSTRRPSGNNEIATGLAIKTFWFKCFPLRMLGNPEGRSGRSARRRGRKPRSKGIISLNRLIMHALCAKRSLTNRNEEAIRAISDFIY